MGQRPTLEGSAQGHAEKVSGNGLEFIVSLRVPAMLTTPRGTSDLNRESFVSVVTAEGSIKERRTR